MKRNNVQSEFSCSRHTRNQILTSASSSSTAGLASSAWWALPLLPLYVERANNEQQPEGRGKIWVMRKWRPRQTMRRGESTTYICTSTLPEAHQPTNTIGKMTILEASKRTTELTPWTTAATGRTPGPTPGRGWPRRTPRPPSSEGRCCCRRFRPWFPLGRLHHRPSVSGCLLLVLVLTSSAGAARFVARGLLMPFVADVDFRI